MSIQIYQLSGRFKSILFGLASVIIISLLFYTQNLVHTLRADARQILEFYAQYYARAAQDASGSELVFIFEEIKRMRFPIILTDQHDEPSAWKGIGLDPGDFSEQNKEKVRAILKVMKDEIEPIPIKYHTTVLAKLYYGDSNSIQDLQRLPYVQIVVVSLFIVVGFVGFNSVRRSEQQFIWVGMAKETAHQLGTPISSIMGWIELLKARMSTKKQLDVLDEMEQDVARLNLVTNRFSQIGSKNKMPEGDLGEMLQAITAYFRKRLPQMGKKVELTCTSTLKGSVAFNRALLEWVLENLIKNALDAIDQPTGTITITAAPATDKKYRAMIEISDSGKGITPKAQRYIFRPGFTTKKRGWGLGLSLARRIVEDLHNGKLLLQESQPDKGTTFKILL